jgi:hypothetical protein
MIDGKGFDGAKANKDSKVGGGLIRWVVGVDRELLTLSRD